MKAKTMAIRAEEDAAAIFLLVKLAGGLAEIDGGLVTEISPMAGFLLVAGDASDRRRGASLISSDLISASSKISSIISELIGFSKMMCWIRFPKLNRKFFCPAFEGRDPMLAGVRSRFVSASFNNEVVDDAESFEAKELIGSATFAHFSILTCSCTCTCCLWSQVY